MSTPAVADSGRPAVRLRGRSYPVILPSLRDPRLHLAAVTLSLHALGQVAFGFRLSIAQILIALFAAALLESGIAFMRRGIILWPASALITGNGVAFILRVPGTEHGDWWSLKGWWLFAGCSLAGIASKYVIRHRGGHILNPSNAALVACFVVFGPDRADPLEFYWSPFSPWLGLAFAIIVLGGLVILRRVRLLPVAVWFWVAFAIALAVVIAPGHEMTARWHSGPLTGLDLWRSIAFSPEILVFLFFMITDPRTIPATARGQRIYAISVAALAAVLIAPWTTEFSAKLAVLGSLTLVTVARPFVTAAAPRLRAPFTRVARGPRLILAGVGVAAVCAVLVAAGTSARPGASRATINPSMLPPIEIVREPGLAALDPALAERVAADLLDALDRGRSAMLDRDADAAASVAGGEWLASLLRGIGVGTTITPSWTINRLTLRLERVEGQGPPHVLAEASGTYALGGSTAPFRQTFVLVVEGERHLLVGSRSASPALLGAPAGPEPPAVAPAGTLPVRLRDVAREVGIDFRHGAFRFEIGGDAPAMMGGGVCWLDADGDGRLDLYATNSYADADLWRWEERGGAPAGALFRNLGGGRFTDVSRGSGTDIRIRANGCVAADFDRDGRTDLYVTAVGADALLWNEGGGRFSDGTQAAGITGWGWHAGAAVGDVNGDGLVDLFVAGCTDPNQPIPGSAAGYPTDHVAVADRLFLNLGGTGRPRFREVARAAGIESAGLEHGLGAIFTDANRDGRLDLFVSNDEDPNRLYLNERTDDGLGFALRDVSADWRVADPNAGMGIAAADFDGDGRGDLVVTNARDQFHAAHTGGDRAYADARAAFASAFDLRLTGWGASWVDLDLDGDLELALANGAIPVLSLPRDAQRLQVLARIGDTGFADASREVGLATGPLRNGRGLAAADYDDDGDLDLAVGSIGGRLVLLENTGQHGNWLAVGLGSVVPGTVVEAVLPDGTRVVREARAGSSYLSSEDPRIRFGLGQFDRVRELVVRFPGGAERRLSDVRANRVVQIRP